MQANFRASRGAPLYDVVQNRISMNESNPVKYSHRTLQVTSCGSQRNKSHIYNSAQPRKKPNKDRTALLPNWWTHGKHQLLFSKLHVTISNSSKTLFSKGHRWYNVQSLDKINVRSTHHSLFSWEFISANPTKWVSAFYRASATAVWQRVTTLVFDSPQVSRP